jgi:DNA-directed RNA polymerase subunit M/transcription elongation factor TFIIS
MSTEDDELDKAMRDAQTAASGSSELLRRTVELRAAYKILEDRICPKCGYENHLRRLVRRLDASGATEHISYVCRCGNHWTGKTLEQMRCSNDGEGAQT